MSVQGGNFLPNGMKKRDVFFLSTNVLSSEPSHLVPQQKKFMFTQQALKELTGLISFGLFTLRVIPHKNGTAISFDFHLIFQFVIVLFLT